MWGSLFAAVPICSSSLATRPVELGANEVPRPGASLAWIGDEAESASRCAIYRRSLTPVQRYLDAFRLCGLMSCRPFNHIQGLPIRSAAGLQAKAVGMWLGC